jgi:hypothetical protein
MLAESCSSNNRLQRPVTVPWAARLARKGNYARSSRRHAVCPAAEPERYTASLTSLVVSRVWSGGNRWA